VRSADFFEEVESGESYWVSDGPQFEEQLHEGLLEQLRKGPLENVSDVSAAIGLLDLVEDELIEYGTSKNNRLSNDQVRTAIRTLEGVTARVGAPLRLPFPDFERFYSYWIRKDAYGSWQARRDLVDQLLSEPRRRLIEIEQGLPGPQIAETLIANLRDPAAIREHLARLQRALNDDPPLAIGTAKELVESTAKTVLAERGQSVNDKDDLPKFVQSGCGRPAPASSRSSSVSDTPRSSRAVSWSSSVRCH
jgi:hypothetical protein